MVALVISGMGIGGLREVGGSKIRSGSKQQRKALWGKRQVGPRLSPGPALSRGWKCEAFQAFVFSALPCNFCILVRKRLGFLVYKRGGCRNLDL